MFGRKKIKGAYKLMKKTKVLDRTAKKGTDYFFPYSSTNSRV